MKTGAILCLLMPPLCHAGINHGFREKFLEGTRLVIKEAGFTAELPGPGWSWRFISLKDPCQGIPRLVYCAKGDHQIWILITIPERTSADLHRYFEPGRFYSKGRKGSFEMFHTIKEYSYKYYREIPDEEDGELKEFGYAFYTGRRIFISSFAPGPFEPDYLKIFIKKLVLKDIEPKFRYFKVP